jgi:hypothetical protein
MSKLSYKILAIVTALVGARAARKLTTNLRDRVNPNLDPTSRQARWVPVLAAAALQAAIEAMVRASAKRGSAATVAKITGEWPAEDKAATAAA